MSVPFSSIAPASSNSSLLDALRVLREGDIAQASRRAAAWHRVAVAIQMFLPRDQDEDLRQEVLIAVTEHAHALRATCPGGAAAWLRAVCRNHRAESYRALARNPLGYGVPLEQAPHASEPLPSLDVVPAIVDAFLLRVRSHLDQSEPRKALRERRYLHALATVRRTVLDESLEEVRAVVWPPATSELIAKWVERGRRVVIATVEAEQLTDPDAAALFEPFAEAARRRRRDAGLPRPSRRRPS